ncbi:unnamed protein product [Rhizoctonia solani]|uniref:Bacteriophage T5 Orf172 DNA-binding domain-containing protein n=1 Tax=Rhizoctonia solani TaxID=456999 RepID=A0A8H3HKT5_9AGAM|nr:unnamed protein product [Rhizoctonia solani]
MPRRAMTIAPRALSNGSCSHEGGVVVGPGKALVTPQTSKQSRVASTPRLDVQNEPNYESTTPGLLNNYSHSGAMLVPASPSTRAFGTPSSIGTTYQPTNDSCFGDDFSTPQPPGAYPISPPPEGNTNTDTLASLHVVAFPSNNIAPDVQCHFMIRSTKKNEPPKRCTRRVKPGPESQAPGVPVDQFCQQHLKIFMKDTGFFSWTKYNTWIQFKDYVPGYLQPATQAALRAEMEKPVSKSDEDGYVYAYEIRDPKAPNEFHIKIGRTVNLVRRLDEWREQCGSERVALRGWWPRTIEGGGQNDCEDPLSLLRGKIKPGKKGKYCHRLERLIHLELSDIALNSTHLASYFNNRASVQETEFHTNPSLSKVPSTSKPEKKPCSDCGKTHQEIFTLQRVASGEMKDREWECIVKPIIKKWGEFVSEHASRNEVYIGENLLAQNKGLALKFLWTLCLFSGYYLFVSLKSQNGQCSI